LEGWAFVFGLKQKRANGELVLVVKWAGLVFPHPFLEVDLRKRGFVFWGCGKYLSDPQTMSRDMELVKAVVNFNPSGARP